MKKSKIARWAAASFTAFTFLFALIIPMGGGIFGLKKDGANAPSEPITATAEATLNSSYDALLDGTSYYYSDVTKIDSFRTGTADTDVSSQEVDRSATHGTAANPFVVNTAKQWNSFASDTANATNANNVFVLGSDIDFDGKTGDEAFKPVPNLGAKFYGANHKLSNLSYNFGNVSTCGLFKNAAATAIITDLNLYNVSFTNITNIGGFICGYSRASVLNCHVQGKIAGTVATSYGFGGMFGNIDGNITVYRCSIFSDATINGTHDGGVGGIFGNVVSSATISVLDCLLICNYKITGTDVWFGGIGSNVTGGSVTGNIENCIVFSNAIDTTNGTRTEASLLGGWARATGKWSVKNTYSAGNITYASKVYDMYGMLYWRDANSYFSATATNYNWYAANPYCGGNMPLTNKTPTAGATQWNGTGNSTRTNMWLAMTADASFKNTIWVNKNIINEAYMTNTDVTSTSGYTIESSPVRNPLKVTVLYYDYKTSGDEQYSIDGSKEPVVVKAGETLYTPDARTGRVFQGWTTDKTGKSAPFTEVPTGMLGDNKLYAVWGIDSESGVVASGEITAKRGGTSLPYGENGYESVYTANGIRLSFDFEVSGVGGTGDSAMSDAVDYEWQWIKGTANIENGTQSTYTVKNVRESGEYKVTVKYRSESEPLFMGTLTLGAKKVTLSKAPLYLESFEFGSETGRPYSGAPYTSSVPTATVTNSENGQGEQISGTTSWYLSSGKFNAADADSETSTDAGRVVVENGKVYQIKTIWFECDESYNGNYGDADGVDEGGNVIERNGQKFEIKFEIEYVQFVFKIEGYQARPNVYVNLQYGQSYTYYNIAALFEEAFKNNMTDFPGLTPVFRKGTDEWTINEYRNEPGTAYKNVSENCTLTVIFREERYRATYNPMNGEDEFEDVNSPVGYGMRLNEPRPAPENGDKLFLGWYYKIDEVDEEGNVIKDVEKKWDFNNDFVMREVSLYARWLTADTLASELEIKIDPSAVFKANAPLDTSMLEVTATFSGTNGEDVFTSKALLSYGQYEIDYGEGNIDGKLHVVGNDRDGIQPTTVVIRYTVRIGGKSQTATKTLELDLERVRVDTEKLKPFFHDTTVEWEEGKAQSLEILEADIREAGLSSQITYKVTYEYSKDGQSVNAEDVIEEGEYAIRASFEVKSADYYAPPITATLTIVPEKIALAVSWDQDEFTYNGKVQKPTFTFKYADRDKEVNVNYTVEDTHEHTGDEQDKCLNAVKVGSYSIKVVLSDTGYKFENGNNFVIVPFTVIKAKVELPEQIEALSYKGEQYDLNQLDIDFCRQYFKNFDPDMMEVSEGATGTTVGVYTAYITLKDPSSAEWSSPSTRVTMTWEIKKAQLSVYWGNKKAFEENGEIQYPKVVRFIGLLGTDAEAVDLEKDVKYNLTGIKAEVGGYSISMSFTTSASWAKNYELDDTKSFSFAIVPMGSGDFTLVTVEWGTTKFKFNEDWQKPEFKLILEEGNENVTDELIGAIMCNGESWELWQGSMWAGKYSVTLSIDPESEYAETYFLVGKPTCEYTILKDGDKGENPNGENPLPPGGGNNGNDNTITGLPLWQLIVGGVSALLFVACTLKSFGEYGKAKAAKREAKELAAQSYAVNYSFVPLPLLAMGAGVKFLGLEETPWTIIALVAVGLFLVSAVMLFMMTKKRKAAELLLKREQARIAEEKEYAREEEHLRREEQVRAEMREEQARRDNEMKMMFAAMQQGGYQQQPMYDDSHIQNLIASTVSALLPAMQQQMALPPAQDPNAYAQPGYVAPSGISAEAQNEINRLHEQMAQQQELINKLIQNQQAPVYEEEEPEDDISWLGENEEMISLEESYGALSDEGKRAYYDIGSYIMNKPRTSQNDGRYAVLFKYRGRTIFKLAIKEDAPVLYYPLNGGRGEVRIADPASLETAKSMVDRCVLAVDNELN